MIRLTITKDQYPQLSKFLSLINYKLDTKSDLAYYLKFGFPDDSEFTEIEVPLEKANPVTEKVIFTSKAKKFIPVPKASEVFAKGKHKGKTYGTVVKTDPQYISWMMENVDHYQDVMFI